MHNCDFSVTCTFYNSVVKRDIERDESMKTIMKISMLGNFRIEYQDKVLEYEELHSLQMTRLLSYLFLNHNEKIDNHTLASYIFKGTDSNPLNGLKALVYRTRTLLREHFNGEQLICSTGGYYYLTNHITYVIDYEDFIKNYEDFQKNHHDLSYARKALSIYHGALLPMIEGETEYTRRDNFLDLALSEMAYALLLSYDSHSIAFSTMARSLLKEKGNNDYLQLSLIRKLVKENQDALLHDYLAVVRPLYHQCLSLATIHSIDELTGKNGHQENDLKAVLTHDPNDQAFECTPREFGRFCQLRRRQLRRGQWNDYVIAITYTMDGYVIDDVKANLLHHLRSGDCVSQFEENQFFLLLQCDEQSIPVIMERLNPLGSGWTFDYRNLKSLRC